MSPNSSAPASRPWWWTNLRYTPLRFTSTSAVAPSSRSGHTSPIEMIGSPKNREAFMRSAPADGRSTPTLRLPPHGPFRTPRPDPAHRRAAGQRVDGFGTIAGGEDPGHAGASAEVHYDSTVHADAAAAQPLDVGLDSLAHNHEIRADQLAVIQAHAFHVAVACDLDGVAAGANGQPVANKQIGNAAAGFRIHHLREQIGRSHNHGHRHPAGE